MKNQWPKTVAEAVDRLLDKELTEENIEKIRHMEKEDLNDLHFGLGLWIRNNFGLFQENTELLEDCAKIAPRILFVLDLPGVGSHRHIEPDGASSAILDALWERLQAEKQ